MKESQQENSKGSAPRTLLIHPEVEAIERIASETEVGRVFSRTWTKLSNRMIEELVLPPLPSDGMWDAVTIIPYLHECRLFLENHAIQIAQKYTSFQLLWYLRKLPQYAFGRESPREAAYDQTLAETISARGRNARQFRLNESRIRYSVRPKVVREVLTYCATVHMLSHIQVLLRLAGRGVHFRLRDTKNKMPIPFFSEEESQVSELYHDRSNKYVTMFSALGSIVGKIIELGTEEDLLKAIMFVLPIEPQLMPVLGNPLPEIWSDLWAHTRYIPRLVSLSALSDMSFKSPLASMNWLSTQTSAVFLLTLIAGPLYDLVNSGPQIITLQQTGYFTIDVADFQILVEANLQRVSDIARTIIPSLEFPKSGAELINALCDTQGTLWPFIPGPVVRRLGDILCVDLYMASMHIQHTLRFPKIDGPIRNIPNFHFKDVVQNAIDASPWRPDVPLRSIRRRQLQFNGKTLTDIDAIGSYVGTLLIVSCKAYKFTAEHTSGDHKRIMLGTAAKLEKDSDFWLGIRKILSENPIGQNYDISRYQQIIPVVCTPRLFYTPIGTATQEVSKGLRLVSTVHELQDWLLATDS